jgi:hypothetical protein
LLGKVSLAASFVAGAVWAGFLCFHPPWFLFDGPRGSEAARVNLSTAFASFLMAGPAALVVFNALARHATARTERREAIESVEPALKVSNGLSADAYPRVSCCSSQKDCRRGGPSGS